MRLAKDQAKWLIRHHPVLSGKPRRINLVKTMLAEPYAFLIATIIGAALGLIFEPKTVGIFGFCLVLADLVALAIAGFIGTEKYVWRFGVAGMILPIYAALAFGGAQIGGIIRHFAARKRESDDGKP